MMGSFASKTWDEMSDFYNNKCSTHSIQTIDNNEGIDNKVGYSVYLAEDPRSPSIHINRTPIQVIDIKQKAIDCDNSGISVSDIMFNDMAIDSDKWSKHMNKLNQLLDPRSPTLDIERTPIDLHSNESSIIVEMSAMRLSFGSNASDSFTQSLQECQTIEGYSDSITSLPEKEEVLKTNENNSGKQERIRTPLASVQRKQTPINVRQRKSLNIEKRAHFNSHSMKNKLRSKKNENNLISTHVSHNKENI